MEKLLKTQDVADCLGIPKSRLYDNWRAWGVPFLYVGQQLRCDPADLEKWIEEQKEAWR